MHSARDLAGALFAPKAHGNMRPLGENAYWFGLSFLFGADPLPFHIVTFVTQAASLLLLGSIVRRLTHSTFSACFAQVLWLVNIGIAQSLGWSSIYNQILSAFFFLLAFYFLVRYSETGRRADWIAQWLAFVLGLGALEINVVYPAVGAAYCLFCSKSLLKKVLPMFAVSALAVLVHFHFAPAPAAGVYAPRLDSRVFSTAWSYWSRGLGLMPPWLTVLLTAAVCLLAVVDVRRRNYAALIGLAWFAIPLLPYLPLPEHRMEYYLAVPAIGIAMLGASAIAQSVLWPLAGRVLTAACVFIYLGACLPSAYRVSRWQYARGERVENLVLGVEEVHRAAPQKIVLLQCIDTDLFWSGIADLPFRALSIPRVYLSPAAAERIQVAPELISKYVLPAALARRAIDAGSAAVYCFDGAILHRVAKPVLPVEQEPNLVNLADDVFRDYFGPGWSVAASGLRSMSRNASVRIGGPRHAAEHLYIGIFETREFHLSVQTNGVEVPVRLVHRDNDLSEFRADLPEAATGWKAMDVALGADLAPLLFGYLEVR